MKRILLSILLIGVATPCFAKAYYAGKKEMIQKAEVIAIVNITKVQETEKKGNHWTYRQKVLGTVERCLKGNAKGEIEIYGMETFICAQCRYEAGRFILFLRREKGFWVGSNWHLGIRSIAKDQVQWFKGGENRFEMMGTPLADVVDEIGAVVKEQKKGTPNKPDAGDGK
ncbi:MAG: hypothetical protein CVU77_06450 [Elusimicrobia bacterium HGW-Elusimicrobia-1]|jgi:hypothetical protein|nr:MAG: hypothetical protein CVU77_06450 [Elusimicrobia bacterium HGW-Elusimicrobia-1]